MAKIGSILSGTVLGAAMVWSLATGASAQTLNTTTTDVQNPYSIKLGILFPTNGSAEKYGGHEQFSLGLDYALTKTVSQNPILPSIYFDYAGGSHSGGHVDTYGAGFAIRTYTASIAGKLSAPYVGAGVGVYDINAEDNRGSKNNVNVGAKVLIGEELGSGLFVEGSYHFLPGTQGINPSGFVAQIGYRF